MSAIICFPTHTSQSLSYFDNQDSLESKLKSVCENKINIGFWQIIEPIYWKRETDKIVNPMEKMFKLAKGSFLKRND